MNPSVISVNVAFRVLCLAPHWALVADFVKTHRACSVHAFPKTVIKAGQIGKSVKQKPSESLVVNTLF